MRVEPRVPKATADISRGAPPRSQFLINSALVVSFFVALFFLLGWIAEGVVHIMPLSWENKLAFVAPDTWLESGAVPHDVSAVFEKVSAASSLPQTFHLSVLDIEQANAMALPGGYIALTRGLIEISESEESLAFVMAHEMGHFKHRHHLKHMSRAIVFGLVRTLLLGRDGAGVIDSAAVLGDLGYSRRQEQEADSFALWCLNEAYGHVGGATTFFESIQDRDDALQFLQTHPLPQSRIEQVEQMIREEQLEVGPVKLFRRDASQGPTE